MEWSFAATHCCGKRQGAVSDYTAQPRVPLFILSLLYLTTQRKSFSLFILLSFRWLFFFFLLLQWASAVIRAEGRGVTLATAVAPVPCIQILKISIEMIQKAGLLQLMMDGS